MHRGDEATDEAQTPSGAVSGLRRAPWAAVLFVLVMGALGPMALAADRVPFRPNLDPGESVTRAAVPDLFPSSFP